ncbi:amidoligase family protein [Actinomadura viridis]|uniref:amidoligase family protein n=1 Tax=Actinomadura viridis TaxID=58110 RepID=UPI003676C6F9
MPEHESLGQAAAATQSVQDDLRQTREQAETLQQRRRDEWRAEEPEVSYTDDPAAFQREYEAARARRGTEEEPVPYMLENATGGLGARDGGRAFGLELEFDIDSNRDRHEALAAIARDMHAEGLSQQHYMQRYHAARRDGYTEAPDGWRLEEDGTVAGEVVSPILYDEPQTWHNLQRICEIIQRHGGTATVRTGGHIHVALPDYDHTVENHNRLLGLVNANEDVLYRLAQNPEAPWHRGITWCRPNDAPGSGYRSVASARRRNEGHHLGLNFESVHGSQSDHVEFRMWDGSLNPAVVQAQIKLSLGLADAASRGSGPALPPEPLGTHRERNSHLQRGQRLSGEAWLADTRSFRSMVDTVFRRSQDKAQAAALFAVTRWQQRR